MSDRPPILYCRCAYAQVVPDEVKNGVLDRLCSAEANFDAVSDLCEMSARKDPRLAEISKDGPLRIAACHPRAVKWLFHAAGCDLDESTVEIVNMREDDAEAAAEKLLAE